MAKKNDLGDVSGLPPTGPPIPIEVARGAMPVDGPPLVPAKKMAENLGISGKTLGRLVKSRQIPAVKIGDQWRFDVGSVRKALIDRAEKSRARRRR